MRSILEVLLQETSPKITLSYYSRSLCHTSQNHSVILVLFKEINTSNKANFFISMVRTWKRHPCKLSGEELTNYYPHTFSLLCSSAKVYFFVYCYRISRSDIPADPTLLSVCYIFQCPIPLFIGHWSLKVVYEAS